MKLVRSLLVWIISINLFVVFRYAGIGHVDRLEWFEMLSGSTSAAIIIGLLFHLSGVTLERKTSTRRSFLSLILLQIGVFVAAIGISGVISLVVISVLFQGASGEDIQRTLSMVVMAPDTLVYTAFVLVVSLIFYYNNQMIKKIGSDRLFRLLIGTQTNVIRS